MAGDLKRKFGANNQALTITIASLASDTSGARTGRQSTEVDNTSNLFEDILLTLKVKSGSSGTASTGHVDLYAFGTVDGGTTRTETAGASDAGITLTDPPNARLVGIVNVVANAVSYIGGPFSLAAAFGGVIPAFWGIILVNESGGALDASGSNHALIWQGIFSQYT